MKKAFILLAVALSSLMMNAQLVQDKVEVEGNPSADISALKLATDLVRYGYATNSPLALTEALQILAETPTQPATNPVEGDTSTEASEGKTGTMTIDANQVLADAKELAKGDKELLAVLDRVEKDMKAETRGRVGGPVCFTSTVGANSYVSYTYTFYANQLAEVLVSGDGDTDLDLYIYDQNGNLIAQDIDYTDTCYCRWTPRWTGTFRIKIVNRGRVYNQFVLATN